MTTSEAAKSWLMRFTWSVRSLRVCSNICASNYLSTMTDPAPKKPQLCLPTHPPECHRESGTERGRGNCEDRSAAALVSVETSQPATMVPVAFPNSSVGEGNGNYTTEGTSTLQETFLGLQDQQKQRGASADRIFPPGVQVVRGEDQGLATGMFCPLCLGDLFQFIVSEKRGFVMCPDRQVVNPSLCIIWCLSSNLKLSISVYVSVQPPAGGIAGLFYGAAKDRFWSSEGRGQGKIGLGKRADC